MEELERIVRVVTPIAVVVLLGLPVMSGLSLWQTIRTRNEGDEALSRSWAEAAKSFFGMMVAGWMMAGFGFWGLHRLLAFVSDMQQKGG